MEVISIIVVSVILLGYWIVGLYCEHMYRINREMVLIQIPRLVEAHINGLLDRGQKEIPYHVFNTACYNIMVLAHNKAGIVVLNRKLSTEMVNHIKEKVSKCYDINEIVVRDYK